MATTRLFPRLQPDERSALLCGEEALSYAQLTRRMAAVAAALEGAERVAVLADMSLET